MNLSFLLEESNRLYLIGYIGCILFVIITILIWFKYGKDINYKNTLKKTPPQTLNPLEFYLVYNGYLKEDSIMPMLLYLSNKDYLTIVEETKNKYILKRNKKIEINNSLDNLIIQILFKKREIINLSEYLNKPNKNTILDEIPLKDAISNITSNINIIFNIINKQKNKYFEYKSDKKRTILLTFITTIIIYITSIPFIMLSKYILLPISVLFSIITLYGIIKLVNKYELQKISFINVISLIFAFIFIWIIFLTPIFSDNIIYACLCLIAIVSVIVILFIYKYMSKRTIYGTKQIKNIEGFKYYIILVNKENLLKEDEYINEILPYTYILGINDILLSKIDNLNIKYLKTEEKWPIKKIDTFFNKINNDIVKKYQQLNKK